MLPAANLLGTPGHFNFFRFVLSGSDERHKQGVCIPSCGTAYTLDDFACTCAPARNPFRTYSPSPGQNLIGRKQHMRLNINRKNKTDLTADDGTPGDNNAGHGTHVVGTIIGQGIFFFAFTSGLCFFLGQHHFSTHTGSFWFQPPMVSWIHIAALLPKV